MTYTTVPSTKLYLILQDENGQKNNINVPMSTAKLCYKHENMTQKYLLVNRMLYQGITAG